MSTILDKIIDYKRAEVFERKEKHSVKELAKSEYFQDTCFSLTDFLLDDTKTGIIAEFKRKSPSKGVINDKVRVEEVTQAYSKHGASALSILTDTPSFGGTTDDLLTARNVNDIPILRKDFIIDSYQIVEARSMGADIILLIAACLTPNETFKLAQFAWELGLEVLLEVHDRDELIHCNEYVNVVGVNNRNLKDFSVDINRSVELAEHIDEAFLKVSESGIHSIDHIKMLKNAGFNGFLIGENFMKETDPGKAFEEFVNKLK